VTGMCGKKSWGRKVILGFCVIAGCSAVALAAGSIKGIVRNQTRGQFAAGDEVILLRLNQTSLNQNLQEETRTKTDPQGSFTFDVHYPDERYLVRVVHHGVNYDRPASAGDAVSIDVFDAVSTVQGVTGSIEIIRIGTAGNHLHVSDMVEIRNDSSPPRTQAGERAFEAYLPARATIDSVLAAGPGKITVLISAAPVPGEPGHYTVNFPLQPGATKFAFNYDLPYYGRATFRPKSMYPLQQLAVMIPPTMKFESRSPAFQVLRAGNNLDHVEAANVVKAGEGPGFEVSGVGALPALRAQVQSPPKPPVVAQPFPASSAPAGSQARVQGTNSLDAAPASSGILARRSQAQWWVLSATAVILVAGGFLFWRRQRLSGTAIRTPVHTTKQRGDLTASLVEALKQELLQLDTERSAGTISGEEYDSARQALEGTVKRAFAHSRSDA